MEQETFFPTIQGLIVVASHFKQFKTLLSMIFVIPEFMWVKVQTHILKQTDGFKKPTLPFLSLCNVNSDI